MKSEVEIESDLQKLNITINIALDTAKDASVALVFTNIFQYILEGIPDYAVKKLSETAIATLFKYPAWQEARVVDEFSAGVKFLMNNVMKAYAQAGSNISAKFEELKEKLEKESRASDDKDVKFTLAEHADKTLN